MWPKVRSTSEKTHADHKMYRRTICLIFNNELHVRVSRHNEKLKKTWQTVDKHAESMWGVSDENTRHLLRGQYEEEVKAAERFLIAFLWQDETCPIQSKYSFWMRAISYLFITTYLNQNIIYWVLWTCWQVSGGFEISTQEKNISNALTENNCMETFSLLLILSSYSALDHSIRASPTHRQSCNAHNMFWVELIKELKIAKRST